LSENERILIVRLNSKNGSEQPTRIFLSLVKGGEICFMKGLIVSAHHGPFVREESCGAFSSEGKRICDFYLEITQLGSEPPKKTWRGVADPQSLTPGVHMIVSVGPRDGLPAGKKLLLESGIELRR
jgi:hypothetical protein